MFKKGKIAAIIVIALILSVTTYAFAAANSVPTTSAGDGAGAISGYTITNIAYGLYATDNSKIGTVTFTITPAAASTVKITLTSGSTTYITCTNTAGSVSCPVNGSVSVTSADSLRVIAVQ
jgi:hypothetical protein